jgi:hypothetical protein
MDSEDNILANLAISRRERIKQLALATYSQAYPTLRREGQPPIPENLEYIIQNKTHLEMLYITNIYAIINNLIESVLEMPGYKTDYLPTLFKTLVKNITDFLGVGNYKYGIFGSNAWYNLFGEAIDLLSDYEFSAIQKHNTKDYIFLVRNTTSDNLLKLEMNTLNELKIIAKYLNIFIQKLLRDNKDNEKFSYFKGKEVYVGVKPYSDKKILFKNELTFSINLFISTPDAIIPENEIIIDHLNITDDYNNYKQVFKEYIKDVNARKRNKDGYEYNLPTETWQLSSYMGKYKRFEKKYKNDLEFDYIPIAGYKKPVIQQQQQPIPSKPSSGRKRKTAQQELEDEEEEKIARSLRLEVQKSGRAARLAQREEQRAKKFKSDVSQVMETDDEKKGGKKKKKGGVFGTTNDDLNSFLKFKLFTFNFNIFDTSIKSKKTKNDLEMEKNETLLFDNFDKLLDKNGDKYQEYFGLEGLYILNKIMIHTIFIPKTSYNPYKIRNYIFEKFIFSDNDPRLILKFEKAWFFAELFEKTFKNFNIIKDFVYDEIKRNIMSVHPDLNRLKTEIENDIIEQLRPYINKTILNINNELNELFFYMDDKNQTIIKRNTSDDKITGAFILGGDAIRRYKYDATITKDIDAKLYIPIMIPFGKNDKINTNSAYLNENKIFKCITNNLIKLLAYLENNKKTIFEPLIKNKSHYEFEDDRNKITIDINYITEDPNIVNFKFRKIGEPKFPADLHSIDYKCVFNVKYGKNELVIPMTVAFIDIVIKQLGNNYFKIFSVFDEDNNLPIASLEFLLSDLLNTYNQDDLSLLRFYAGKSDKDYDRINLLWDIFFQQKGGRPIYTKDSQNIIHFLNEEQIEQNKELNKIVDYSIDTNTETGDKLYLSITEIINHLIDKGKITSIDYFNNYKNPNIVTDQPGAASSAAPPVATETKTGGRFEEQQRLRTFNKTSSRYYTEPPNLKKLELQSFEQKEVDNNYRYTEHNITKYLMNLMRMPLNEMHQKLTTLDNYNPKTYMKIKSFNNNFYRELADILTPKENSKIDKSPSLYFTNLSRNINRIEENIDILFRGKKMSDKKLKYFSRDDEIDEDENDN